MSEFAGLLKRLAVFRGRREAKLLPGMPADVHIRTTDRTVVSYLIKPLQDQFARAFRER